MGWLGSRAGPRRASLDRNVEHVAYATKGLRCKPGPGPRPVGAVWRLDLWNFGGGNVEIENKNGACLREI